MVHKRSSSSSTKGRAKPVRTHSCDLKRREARREERKEREGRGEREGRREGKEETEGKGESGEREGRERECVTRRKGERR